MRKITKLLAALLLLCGVAACGRDTVPPTAAETTPEAIVTPPVEAETTADGADATPTAEGEKVEDDERGGQPIAPFVFLPEYPFDDWVFTSAAKKYSDFPDLGALLGFEPARVAEAAYDGFYLEFDLADVNGLYADADALLEAARTALYDAKFISFFTIALDGDTLRATFMANPQPGAVEALGYDGPKFNTEYLDFIVEVFADVPDAGAMFGEPPYSYVYEIADKTLTQDYVTPYAEECSQSYDTTMANAGFVPDFENLYLERGSIKSGLILTVEDDSTWAIATAVWKYLA